MASRTKNLTVQILGDASGAKRAFGEVDKAAAKTESRLGKFKANAGKAFAIGGAAAGGALVVGLTKATEAAIEAEKSQARMQAQLKASGISYQAHAKEIDRVIQRTSRLAAVDDEDLQDAFTNIVRTTGDVTKSLQLTGVAADLAAAKQLDVGKAGEIVAKVAGGNTGILSRYGVTIKEGASASEALAALQQKFAGQAERYGQTTAGSMDRARNSLENLEEAVGQKTAPLLAKGADAFSGLITGTNGAGRAVSTAVQWIKGAFEDARAAVERFASRNRERIQQISEAARRLGTAFKVVFEEVVVPVVRRAVEIIGRNLERIGRVVAAIVDTVTAIINGDWAQAWDGFKRIVTSTVGGIAGYIKDVGSAIWDATTALGKLIVRGILKGMGNLGHAILAKIKDAAGWVKDKAGDVFSGIGSALGLGDGIGDAIGKATPRMAAPGSLMGANRALAPIAAVGAAQGLHVSSGLRRGAVTSSGNRSFHATGEAVDMVGSPGGMLRTFKTLKSRFGSRLSELIYSPGGVGVKSGRPFRYSGQVAADHYDHVHAAVDLPGVGDGIGEATKAARAAGFRGRDLVTAVAIAGAESGWRNSASNKQGEYSIGMWQINMDAHGQRFGSEGALRSAATNAKAAYALFKGRGGFGDWTMFTNGQFQRFVDQARQAATASRSGSSRRSRSSGSRGTTGEAISPHTTQALTPAEYEQQLAENELGIAQASPGGGTPAGGSPEALRLAEAVSAKRKTLGARIRKVRAALKRNLRPATRLRLTQELATLVSEHRGLGEQGQELRTAAAADTGGDPNQPLIDSNNALAAAIEQDRVAREAHTAMLEGVRGEMKRQTDLATSAVGTQATQAWKALANIMSGELGAQVRVRNYGPGTGVRFAL